MIALKDRWLHSANIQAEFYNQCGLNDIPCILEYKHERSRFDAVIHDYKNILIIVEIKNHIKPWLDIKYGNQLNKYKSYGLPMLLVRCYEDIPHTINSIINILYNVKLKNQKQG